MHGNPRPRRLAALLSTFLVAPAAAGNNDGSAIGWAMVSLRLL